MKKIFSYFKQPLFLVLLIEIIAIFLIAGNILPRELTLPLVLLFLIFIVLFNSKKGLYFFIASIPFFVALPITETFDSMSSWRILLTGLFLSWAIKSWYKNKKKFTQEIKKILSEKFIMLVGVFFLIAGLSLYNSISIFAGIKKILFLVNIAMLYVLIVSLIKNKQDIIDCLKTAAFVVLTIVGIGFLQFFITVKYPLYEFWQFWAKNVIGALYGQGLSSLLQVSNSWFSYYENALPTLRMFSVFPDTHSFALIGVLGIPILLTLMLYYWQDTKKRIFFAILNILTILSIILSGSRGIWISIVFPIISLASIYLLYKKFWNKKLAKLIIATFLAFAILFPFSTFIFQMTQPPATTEAEKNKTFLIFERAKSISNILEISNKGRLEIWKQSVFSIARQPLLGVGIGNYPIVLELDVSASKQGASAHNIYLDVASEMGIIALFVFIAIFIFILSDAVSLLKQTNDKIYYLFILSFIIYTSWILCYSLFDVVLFNDKVLLLFMVNLGILYVIKNLSSCKYQLV